MRGPGFDGSNWQADLVAVIGMHQHDRLVIQVLATQPCQQYADVLIYVRNRGVVGVPLITLDPCWHRLIRGEGKVRAVLRRGHAMIN